MNTKHERIGRHIIFLNQMYYLTCNGGKRELTSKDQKIYNQTLHLPFLLSIKEKGKIPLEKNPDVIPLTGSMLMSFIRELKFVPFFDYGFEESHLLMLKDPIIYESIRQKTYDMAMKNLK